MQTMLIAAGVVMALTGLAHSTFGEVLIFRGLRKDGIVPTSGGTILRERHVRILWASWHLVSILGWAIAIVLICIGLAPDQTAQDSFFAKVAAVACLTCAALVLFATRGRHPGWISLSIAAILAWTGSGGL